MYRDTMTHTCGKETDNQNQVYGNQVVNNDYSGPFACAAFTYTESAHQEVGYIVNISPRTATI